jgi:hypothetical protein
MGAYLFPDRLRQDLSPEQELVVAMLRQALADACHAPYDVPRERQLWSWQGRDNAAFAAARAWFLEEREAVEEWLAVLNLPEGVYDRLLCVVRTAPHRVQQRDTMRYSSKGSAPGKER